MRADTRTPYAKSSAPTGPAPAFPSRCPPSTYSVCRHAGPADAVAVALAGVVAMNQFIRADRPTVLVQAAASRWIYHRPFGASSRRPRRGHLTGSPETDTSAGTGFDAVLDSIADLRRGRHDAFDGSGADIVVDNISEPTLWASEYRPCARRRHGDVGGISRQDRSARSAAALYLGPSRHRCTTATKPPQLGCGRSSQRLPYLDRTFPLTRAPKPTNTSRPTPTSMGALTSAADQVTPAEDQS